MEPEKKKRGGARPGAGPKPMPPGQKRIAVSFRMLPSHFAALKKKGGTMAGHIDAALNQYINKKTKPDE